MKKNKKNRHYTIGLIIDWIENPYHVSLLRGIKESAKDNNVNLIAFVGGAINSPRPHEKLRNIIYQYVNRKNIDGIIILSGSVGHYCSIDELNAYCNRFQPLPMVSISQTIENAYSILVDNENGLRELIIHLIEDHGYKKIAFIRGPEGNLEADIRYNVYLDVLKTCNIPFNPGLVAPGHFIQESGVNAVDLFYDREKAEIDAIVASNDDMAFGAMNALQKRGKSIPIDVAVAGFDDQDISKYTCPSLTTVRQPLYKQGYKAVEVLCSLLKGEEQAEEYILPTELIIRESCGCLLKDIKSFKAKKPEKDKTIYLKADEDNSIKISRVSKSMDKYLEEREVSIKNIDSKLLVEKLFESIEQEKPDIFLSIFKLMLIKIKVIENMMESWYSIINAIRIFTFPLIENMEKREMAEQILYDAHFLVSSHYAKINDYKKFNEDRDILRFRDVSEILVAFLTLEDIIAVLARELPHLGIKSCYFSLYESSEKQNVKSSVSHLILAYNENKQIKIEEDKSYFPTENLVPDGILPLDKKWSLVLEPIFFGSNQLGLALFELKEREGFAYDVMRRMFLNSALKGAIFIQKVQKQTHYLEETNWELIHALKSLKKAQTQLIESEKMSALGGLVAGIAHEINTPIGIGVTAASHLTKTTEELINDYKKNMLKRSDFEKYLPVALEASSMILSNLKRAYELIRSFKQIAIDQSSEEKRRFNVKEYIAEVLISLRPKLKKTKHTIDIKCPEKLEINSYPGAFSQIITNLIMNSLLHAYNDEEAGIIKLDIKKRNEHIHFKYSDNGRGIEKENLEKIFNPFFTTSRRKGGTGLGLHILYNIVTQRFNGTVKCESAPGKGTNFFIIFPLLLKENDSKE